MLPLAMVIALPSTLNVPPLATPHENILPRANVSSAYGIL